MYKIGYAILGKLDKRYNHPLFSITNISLF